jgi:hypothetical protein
MTTTTAPTTATTTMMMMMVCRRYRMYGGELTGSGVVLDMEEAPHGQGAATFSSFGTYFASYGSDNWAVKVMGNWNNVHFYGNRGEMGCPKNPCASGRQDCPACNTRFLSLEGENTTVNNFNFETYGDGDAIHNMVWGNGSLHGGTITGSGNIDIQGNIEGVTVNTGSRMNLTVDGSVTSTAVHSTRTCVKGTHDMCIGAGGYNPITGTGTSADGFGVLNVSGKLEVTNGGGGAIVHHTNGPSGGEFKIDDERSISASYGGCTLELICAHAASRGSVCKEVAAICLPDKLPYKETLSWTCHNTVPSSSCVITAAGAAPHTLFVVRKTA